MNVVVISHGSNNKDLINFLNETFEKNSVSGAKYVVGDIVNINWNHPDIYDYFYKLNKENVFHTKENINQYKEYSAYRILKSEVLTDFDGKPSISYNLEPVYDTEPDGYFLYFMPESFLIK